MVRPPDPFWAHVEDMNGLKKCKFCGQGFGADTSISRIKWHLSGVKGRGVTICAEVPKDVQEAAFLATLGSNKRYRMFMPGSSNSVVTNAVSTSPQGQNNEVANLASDLEGALMEDNSTEPEVGKKTDFSCSQQSIQTSISWERFPAIEHEATGARIQPTVEVDLLLEKDWSEIYASSATGMLSNNEVDNTIASSLQGQKNPVENGAMEVDMQQEHQPLANIFNKVDIFVEAALHPLFEKLMSPDLLKFAYKHQLDSELKKWESKLLQIHAVLNDAEDKQVKNLAVKCWLRKLRDLAYDVDDILDKFQTEALSSKLKSADSQASTSTAQELHSTFLTNLQPSVVMINWKTKSKLSEITARLDKILNEKNDMGLCTNVGGKSNTTNRRVPTTSLLREPKVYGRDKVKEDLIELLMSGEPSNLIYSVIPIVGMGGIGKTTVAQLLYSDKRVKFDHKAWVCVSDDFDISRITKSILQHWESCKSNNLNVLQLQLKDKLHGKKFLIVLDDIWQHKYDDWTTLCSPFIAGAPGSKIIVTTRSKDVSSRISTAGSFELKELLYDECLCLFAHHAVDAENLDAHPDLKEVGQKIVQRCRGLPLAAKTLGGLLRHEQHIQEWEDILNSEIWELSEEDSSILPVLRLSYHHLPSHLKRCFDFCAIFPKDYEFDKNELILMWMAEGFLPHSRKKKLPEDYGHEYFNDLVSRSFFQQSVVNSSRYVMHDLINDVARFASGDMCFHLVNKPKDVESSSNVRYSSFIPHFHDTWKRFEVFNGMKSLRTFLALPSSERLVHRYLSSKVTNELLPAFENLRTVSLAAYASLELPDSFSTLKQLRFLNLSYTLITRLPESVSDLLNLQTLKLCGCKKLTELPTNIGNLINLHHLDVGGTDSLKEMPLQISKLTNLCTLPKFIVGKSNGLGIRELIKLPHLQGKLSITGLHNVANIQDAKFAKLKEKQGLCELALEWIDDFNSTRSERHELQVLDSLQPHQNLEKLSITSYGGLQFPSWMGDSSFTEMVQLQLFDCRKITSLPSLGKLPGLKHLWIQGMDGVKAVSGEDFPLLETLIFEDMLRWKHWSWSRGPDDEEVLGKFPKLRKLKLVNCPKLVGKLPNCLPSLKELHVEGCQEGVLGSLPNRMSLTTLIVSRISGLSSLHEVLLQGLVALEQLEIEACEELVYLWQHGTEGNNLEKKPNGLHSLPSLRELEISECPNLLSFPEGAGLPCTLKHLEIKECESLESLPDGMMTMMNGKENSSQCLLEVLRIRNCPSLKSFPRGKLPATLKNWTICGCQNLESLPEGIMSLLHLEHLNISSLSLRSFPISKFPTSLKRLYIYNCKIESLPSLHNLSHLTWVQITGCPELESFSDGGLPCTNLCTLLVMECKKLRSLFILMDKLTSLQTLEVSKCGQLESISESGLPPNINKLTIYDCQNLRQPMSEWGLCALTSLKDLWIDFRNACTRGVDYFPHDDSLLLPTCLTFLRICDHKNLKFISSGLQKFTSLQGLWFENCPNLKFLPKEGFPPTLGWLYIMSCPLLGKRCLKEKGVYWPIVSHIPRVLIDGVDILQQQSR